MADREVELFDYLSVLWRWKWLIVLMTLASMLVAGLVTWRTPRTYRVTATIDTGDLSEARDRDVERLVARVNAKASAPTAGAGNGARPAPLTVQYRRPAVIELSSETRAPAEAVQTLQQAATGLVEDLNRLLALQRAEEEAKIRATQDQLEELEDMRPWQQRRVEDLRRSLDRLHAALAQASRRSEDPASSLVSIRLSEVIVALENDLARERRRGNESPGKVEELKRRITALTQQTTALRPAQVAVAPEIPRIAIRPRPRLNLAVGFAAGLAGATLLAFLVEYLQRAGVRPRRD